MFRSNKFTYIPHMRRFTPKSIKVCRKTQPQSVIAFDTRERNDNIISSVKASLPAKLPDNNYQMITLVGYNANASHQKSLRRNHDYPHPHSLHHNTCQEDQRFQAAGSNPGR